MVFGLGKEILSSRALQNQDPNVIDGRETPIAHRKPQQQRLAARGSAALLLSPTKRRKQSHSENEGLKCLSPASKGLDFSPPPAPQVKLNLFLDKTSVLHEVFCRLGAKDIVERVAPTCKLWSEVAHGKDLWEILRRHVRLVDRLLVVEKVVERRSKGKLFRCQRLGAEGHSLLRVVDLELTNAGKDDGVPTSFLREAALLSRLRHPNIIRFFGSEILVRQAVMCTEFIHESFATWYKRLEVRTGREKSGDIQVKFRQLLTGLSYVHHRGVMHRNLKPDNIFLDEQGLVKIGDFTITRMLDIPFQAYTPEDPKERDRSGREMRRLWYRAPELLLRDEIYGPKVDMWSVGCLLAEAASGKALLPSDSEIDHLFRTFRLIGTPTPALWPEMLRMKNFSPKFPAYTGLDFSMIARAACHGSVEDQDVLVAQARPDRTAELQQLFQAAVVLGPTGMDILGQTLLVPPSARSGADALLEAPFFASPFGGLPQELDLGVMDDAPPGHPPSPLSAGLISPRMVWDVVRAMQDREGARVNADSDVDLVGVPARPGAVGATPGLPAGLNAAARAGVVDFVIGLANSLGLTDFSSHLAVTLLDRYFELQVPSDEAALQQVGAACLKIADVFTEQSKEYYKQENAAEYAEATGNTVTAQQLLSCEKDVLPKLGFDLHRPTVHWFLQCYLQYARFAAEGRIARTAFFIADLMLLDHHVLAYAPSLRSQCALLLAVFISEQSGHRAGSKAPSCDGGAVPLAAAGENFSGIALALFEAWDQDARNHVCHKNTAIGAAMCLQAVVHILVVLRREWKGAKLNSVETKHGNLARMLAYPEKFPVSKLVRYILPDAQRGLLPE